MKLIVTLLFVYIAIDVAVTINIHFPDQWIRQL